jgi:tRNA(fMet)-specific endonuclease VapC
MAVKPYSRMTGNKILLDTNIISALLKGEPLIADKIDKASAVFIPAIVIGELYYGALYSSRIQKNTASIQLLTNSYKVLPVETGTTVFYGTIKALLRKKGKPIPENDIWIAAIALQHNLTVVSRDKHFKEITGLKLKTW